MSPLFIFALGVIVVVGMIIILRVNAFVALIMAAVLVSLLSPGDTADKISRVANAFGGVVGAIGIVIALAAVVGKCLMDSGAADRIVRAFLKLLGEKRSSWALMSSGFVLSIPVFFDTVFYLLVPLARSLCRRTRKDYLLYLTAIVAGAGVAHSLIPPTPGPLFMASRLNIDVGHMILVGILVGLPTAVVGLLVCKVLNRFVDIPMRPYGGEAEPEPLPDEQLPALWISLLPGLLPVILISANTIATAFARAELVDQLTPSIVSANIEANPGDAKKLARKLVSAKIVAAGADIAELTKQIEKAKIAAQAEAEALAQQWVEAEIFVDDADAPHGARDCANITAVLGNPSLALLFSAVIAMTLLVRQRKIPLRDLARTVDKALMSGGIIILITAAGGAFGAMLRAAGVQQSVADLVGTEGQRVGTVILLLAFAVASVVKIAQGSGTVSMITTTSMFAAMGMDPDMLGCHPVYLATAIGSGSLVGDWMNNSGFWIFARMGVLGEAETLKSWTILTAMLGLAGLGFTLLFATLMPMPFSFT